MQSILKSALDEEFCRSNGNTPDSLGILLELKYFYW